MLHCAAKSKCFGCTFQGDQIQIHDSVVHTSFVRLKCAILCSIVLQFCWSHCLRLSICIFTALNKTRHIKHTRAFFPLFLLCTSPVLASNKLFFIFSFAFSHLPHNFRLVAFKCEPSDRIFYRKTRSEQNRKKTALRKPIKR